MIDLSAAFDTISHQNLLAILRESFGIGGRVLEWIKSYLSGRTFQVKINSALCDRMISDVGVPQGSVLGPVFFNCVMRSLPGLLDAIGVKSHVYADDTQFWVSFNKDEEVWARAKIAEAFNVISEFMLDNSLKLNANKTMFIPFTRSKQEFRPLELDDTTVIAPQYEVRNLGVIFDSQLTFNSHVSSIRKTAFHSLRRIRHIRPFIPEAMLPTLIHSFVSSRLDFCNSLLYGLPACRLQRVQTVQNACAKFLTGAKRFDSATEQLKILHWLPVMQRSKFKQYIFAHKVAHCDAHAPGYFGRELTIKVPNRLTRSSTDIILVSRYRPKLKTVGWRSMSHTIPDLWNNLPNSLRNIKSLNSFKSQLKTHLFREYFKD
jgi:hypothetical protein